MKKTIAMMMVSGMATLSGFSQGAITFGNINGDLTINAPVMFGGVNVGAGYSAQLFAGTAGTSEGGLTAMGSPVPFNTGVFAGYISDVIVTITGVSIGQTAAVQFRAWDNAGGTITSWANAAIRGQSTVFTSAALGDAGFPSGDANAVPPKPPVPSMTGLGTTPITLAAVPEPSTVVLGVMGGLALLLRRRK